VQNKKAISKKF